MDEVIEPGMYSATKGSQRHLGTKSRIVLSSKIMLIDSAVAIPVNTHEWVVVEDLLLADGERVRYDSIQTRTV